MSETQINRAFRDAWIVGLVALFISVSLTAVYISAGGINRIDYWNILEIVGLAGLSYGIYRRNHLSAILMPIVYFGSKIPLWISEKVIIGLPAALFFTWFFVQAARAAIAEHKISQPA